VQALSGQAAGIVDKDLDFEQGRNPGELFSTYFSTYCRHPGQDLLRRQIIQQPQFPAFVAPAIQENYRGHAPDGKLADETLVHRIALLGEVHFDHDKISVRQFNDVGVMKGDFLRFPAGGAPGDVTIDDHRPVADLA